MADNRKPKKVMLLLNALARGGAERQALELVKGIDRARFRMSVCAMRAGGTLHSAFAQTGAPVVVLRKRMPADPIRLLELVCLLRRERVDILHAFLTPQIVWGYVAARLAAVPVFIPSVRNTELDEPAWWAPILKYVLGRSPVIHVNAEATVRYLKQQGLADPERAEVIPNGIDISRFGPHIPRGKYRRRLGLDDNALLVGTVGRLVPQKNITLFLHMAREVTERGGLVHFVIAGDGPLREELKRQAGNLGIGEYVHFVGEIGDVPSLMTDLDIFVLSSDWEGMPNVVAEAMAAQVPVVATAVGGTPELVQDGRTGLLVHPRRLADLTNAVLELLGDEKRRAQIASEGRSRIEQNFTVERMVSRVQDLYERSSAAQPQHSPTAQEATT